MTVTAISLTDPVSGLSVPILPADGVSAQVLDVSAPARAVTEDRVGAYGSYDVTQRLSAGAVSLSLLLYPGVTQTQEKFLDTLAPLLSPAMRPVLVVTNDQWAQPRQIAVRFDSKAMPLSDPSNLPVQISWQAPNAVWEASSLVQAFVSPQVQSSTGITIGTTGITITTAGIVMAASSQPSDATVTSVGAAPSQWTAFIYGPCTGPKLALDSAEPGLDGTGQGGSGSGGQAATGVSSVIEFTDDVVLAAGSYIALDSLNRTAYLNSDTSQPMTGFINFSTLNWFTLQPGVNLLRFYPTAAGAGAVAALSFRPNWYL